MTAWQVVAGSNPAVALFFFAHNREYGLFIGTLVLAVVAEFDSLIYVCYWNVEVIYSWL